VELDGTVDFLAHALNRIFNRVNRTDSQD
jgi:hypothetical protein